MLDTVTTHLFSNKFSNSNLNTEYNADYIQNIEPENYIRERAVQHRAYTSFWNFVIVVSVVVISMILFFIICFPIFIRLYKRCRTTLRNYFYPTSEIELPFTIRTHIASIPCRQNNSNFLEVYRMHNVRTREMI
ncbi:uncharacterized protein LOC115233864 [Formica exsecta]|uniref:uncharacterized protein LOC115233864 n=1 Tax=Formica exsecta TaxID=72781 RepID=UPI001143D0E9|nr:uncharacterized protein LOC115233864 [Formica exsecta]